jgi:hypothetical protein
MIVSFFLVLKHDVSHVLHAASLVTDVQRVMPGTEIEQLTDDTTPAIPGVTRVRRHRPYGRPLLDQRLELYAASEGDRLFLDTDVAVAADVRGVFDDHTFDVAVTDRHWPHLPQGDQMMHTMPFNTGVVFSRSQPFWCAALAAWRAFPAAVQADWMSEQQAVYQVIRSGRYRVKILPGLAYNYPPRAADDAPRIAALRHYKGPRKAWLSVRAQANLATPIGGRA